MAQIGSLGLFRGYGDNSEYGNFNVYFNYTASGTTLSNMSIQLSKDVNYKTTSNTAYIDSITLNGTSKSCNPTSAGLSGYNTAGSGPVFNLTDNYTSSSSSVEVVIKMHRSGQSANAQTFTGTITGLATKPTGLSCSVSSKTETSVSLSGSYTSNGGASVTSSGFQYSTNGTTWTNCSSTISGLTPNTTYYFRYYATNVVGTSYSSSTSTTTYKVPTQSLSSKTETTITMNWAIDSTADYIWYSINNGSSWTAVGSVNASSGSYTISGLNPNATYNIKTRIRRKASQTTYDTTVSSQTTYKVPTQSLKSKTETTITMSWSVDSTANYIWYSIDNGSNWTAVGSVNSTSGSYTISGLSANTSYNIKTRVRRSATNTTYDTTVSSQTTYNYPYITAVSTSALIIGNSQTLTLYNPLSRSVMIKMHKDSTSGTQLYRDTLSGTSITFTPDSTTLYNSIPSSQSANCVYSVICGSSTKTTGTYTYKIRGDEYPTFSESNWSYTANLTELTKDNQVIINNNSTVNFSINTQATSAYGSSIDKYVYKWGNKSSTSNSVSKGNGNILTIIAYDKRGLTRETSKILDSKYIDYNAINVLNASADRENGIGTTTKLNLRLKLSVEKFGTNGVDNNISSANYQVNNGTAITIPVSNFTKSGVYVNLENFNIHQNGTSGGFPIGTRFTLTLNIKDALGLLQTTTFNVMVTDGKIAVDCYQDSSGDYHRGINGLANSSYTEQVNGTFNATKLYQNGLQVLEYEVVDTW